MFLALPNNLLEKNRKPPRRVLTCKVNHGRAKVVCRNCEKNWYIPAPVGVNEKLVRCQCGSSTFIHFDRRSHPRESICRLGALVFPQNYSIPVYLCDASPVGISFICTERDSLMLTKNLSITIKYRSEDGNEIVRQIILRNQRKNRFGAEFLGLPLT